MNQLTTQLNIGSKVHPNRLVGSNGENRIPIFTFSEKRVAGGETEALKNQLNTSQLNNFQLFHRREAMRQQQLAMLPYAITKTGGDVEEVKELKKGGASLKKATKNKTKAKKTTRRGGSMITEEMRQTLQRVRSKSIEAMHRQRDQSGRFVGLEKKKM